MNTITTQENNFIETYDIESFNKVIQSFRKKANLSGLTAREHIIYNIVRGLPKERGFTPIINKIKLQNGLDPNIGYKNARSSLLYSLRHEFEYLKTEFNLPLAYKEYLINAL